MDEIAPHSELKSLLSSLQKNLKLKRSRFRYEGATVRGERNGPIALLKEGESWAVVHLPTGQRVVSSFSDRSQAETFMAAILELDGWDTDDETKLTESFQSPVVNLRSFIRKNSVVPSACESVLKRLRKDY